MKRRKGCLAALFALLMLTGCVTTKPLEQDRLPHTEDQTAYTDYPGMEIEIVDIRIKNGEPVLRVRWKNNTDFFVSYGAPYGIQRQEDGQWVNCAVEETAFISIAYGLEPGQSRQESYYPMPMFDMTRPGVYRFVTGCSVHAGKEGSISCKLWAEFTLSEGTVSSAEPEFKEPPRVTVFGESTGRELKASGYSWFCDQADGTTVATIADGVHPLYCRDTMEKLQVTGTKGKLEFERMPDEVSIRCWPDTAWERSDIPAETVAVSAMEFDFKTGGWIYEVTATWIEAGRSSHGEAHYYFYAEVQP